MITRSELTIIDKYLGGTLSKKETVVLEQRMGKDDKFYREVEQIRLIVAGIQNAAIVEELEKIRKTAEFIERGGILLRQGENDNGEAVIERLSVDSEWCIVLICENDNSCSRLIRKLVKKHPKRFRTLDD